MSRRLGSSLRGVRYIQLHFVLGCHYQAFVFHLSLISILEPSSVICCYKIFVKKDACIFFKKGKKKVKKKMIIVQIHNSRFEKHRVSITLISNLGLSIRGNSNRRIMY